MDNNSQIISQTVINNLQVISETVTNSQISNSRNLLEFVPPSFNRQPRSRNSHRRTWFRKCDFSFAKPKVVVNHENKSQKKYEGGNENETNLRGLGVVYVNKEEVDLNYLAREGDGACEVELASMTEDMSRLELVGFMESLQGQWCGRSDRRKLVDAGDIVKALPENWKIELAVLRWVEQPSLYCRSYVSPSGEHFKSCKDVAFFLRKQSLIDVAGPFKEGDFRQMKNGGPMFLKSINKCSDSGSSANEANIKANDLYDVEVVNHIDCSPCGLMFEDMAGLEKHLGIVHQKTTRRFNPPTNEGSKPCMLVQLDKGCAQQNGHASSRSQETGEAQEAVPFINGNGNGNGNGRFKTNCTWCFKEFLSEPVDAETMADAIGFMCPQCKKKLWGVLEGSLSSKH